MNSSFFKSGAALLTLVCCTFLTTAAFSQTVSALTTAQKEAILSAGDAGKLRNHLLVSLKGKIEKSNLSETIVVPVSGGSLTCDIIAILIGLKVEKVELVSIRVTQGAKVSSFNLVQYPDGTLSELQGNDLVAYSHTKEVTACIGGAGTNCAGCATNGSLARSASVAQKVSAFFKSANSNCLKCYGDIDDVIACITGHK